MCDTPYILHNPAFDDKGVHRTKYSCLHDTRSPFIEVPCGHCQACLRMAQQYMVQRFREHCKGRWTVFCTATYKDDALPHLYSTGIDGTVYDTPYADVDDFRLMVKRIRKNGLVSRPFTYWCTTEYGGEKHRPHFHYFIFFDMYDTDTLFDGYALAEEWNCAFIKEWRRNIAVNRCGKANTRKPIWLPLSKFIRATITRRGTYDVHLLTNEYGDSDDPTDAVFYASKYTLKFDEWTRRRIQAFHESLDPETYKEFYRCFRPRFLMSRAFGISENTEQYIRDCIEWSVNSGEHYACYVNMDGKKFPLCRYYRQKFMTVHDILSFVRKHPEDYLHEPNGDLYDLVRLPRLPESSREALFYLRDKVKKDFDFRKIVLHLSEEHSKIIFDDD